MINYLIVVYDNIVKTSRGLLRERKIRWISGVEYHEGDGRVSFTLTNEILPHVSM